MYRIYKNLANGLCRILVVISCHNISFVDYYSRYLEKTGTKVWVQIGKGGSNGEMGAEGGRTYSTTGQRLLNACTYYTELLPSRVATSPIDQVTLYLYHRQLEAKYAG
jgi:hypothetical protein